MGDDQNQVEIVDSTEVAVKLITNACLKSFLLGAGVSLLSIIGTISVAFAIYKLVLN